MNAPTTSEEAVWCASERTSVIEYLKKEGLVHGDVGEWPSWHIYPHVAVWAVGSAARPGNVGWWAISGDVPTDYTTCGSERHPREGVKDIALRWQAAASQWEKGFHTKDWTIGSADNEAALTPLLASRACLLLSYAADDSLWSECV